MQQSGGMPASDWSIHIQMYKNAINRFVNVLAPRALINFVIFRIVFLGKNEKNCADRIVKNHGKHGFREEPEC